MAFTRWHDPIARVLAAYPGGPGLVAALETLIRTAEENAYTRAKDDLAQRVCEGVHPGPASGLKCRACYEAERIIPIENQVRAEMEVARRLRDDEPIVEGVLVDD